MHTPTTVRYLVRGAIIVLLTVGVAIGVLWNAPESNAGGNTIITVDTTGIWTSLALDGSGNPVVSYYDPIEGDLRILHCSNPNCSTGNSITLPDTEGDVGQYTSLVLDSGGNPVISYYDATNRDLKLMHCNDANCAGGDESITSPDAGGNVGEDSSLLLDGSGNPVISYYDATNRDLKVMHCNDANCAGGDESITSPDTAGWVGWSSSLALDTTGNPVVSYGGRNGAHHVKVLHCGSPNCDPGNVITTFAGVGGTQSVPTTALVLDTSGNPVISYIVRGGGLSSGALHLLHCGDASCSAGNVITTVVRCCSSRFPSLALDALGNPVVSLQRTVSRDLWLLHCNDVNCAGDDESLTTPDTNSAGWYTSLALDDSGNPVVSYAGSDGLRVLHCSNPTCGAGEPETPTPTSPAPDTETPTPPASDTATPTPLSPATSTPVPATATPAGLPGDVNCEGTVNSIDVALVLQFSAGLVRSLACEQNADVNGDGGINAIDASLILQFVAGLLPSL